MATRLVVACDWALPLLQSYNTDVAALSKRRSERETQKAANLAEPTLSKKRRHNELAYIKTIDQVKMSLKNRKRGKKGLKKMMKDLEEREDLLHILTEQQRSEDAAKVAKVVLLKTKQPQVHMQPTGSDGTTIHHSMSADDLDTAIEQQTTSLVSLLEERRCRVDASLTEPRKATMLSFMFSPSGGESFFADVNRSGPLDQDLLALARARYGHVNQRSINASKRQKKSTVAAKYRLDMS